MLGNTGVILFPKIMELSYCLSDKVRVARDLLRRNRTQTLQRHMKTKRQSQAFPAEQQSQVHLKNSKNKIFYALT